MRIKSLLAYISRLFLWCIGCCLIHPVQAQDDSDSLNVTLEQGFYYSSNELTLPHYLVFNRFGKVDETDEMFLGVNAFYQKQITPNITVEGGLGFRNDIATQYYLRSIIYGWELKLGRLQETIGGLSPELSSGSLAISNNALPLTQVGISTNGYKEVPFTKGYFKLKGSISHRWLGEDRVVRNAYLHEKSFYALVDLPMFGLELSSGLVHFAQWGGTLPNGDELPSSFSDFGKVFLGRGSGEETDGSSAGEANALGNHLGITEIGIRKYLKEHVLDLRYQKPFEDGGSAQLLSFKDYLVSVEWQLPPSVTIVNKVLVEYMQTKSQGGPGLPDFVEGVDNFGFEFGGRDDYYNNFLYRSGWTNRGQVMGSPLFLTHDRLTLFTPFFPSYDVAIANNRLSAFHLAASGVFKEKLNYSIRTTFTRNFGTYAGIYQGRFNWFGIQTNPEFEYPLRPALKQFYGALQVGYDGAFGVPSLNINVIFAVDQGEIYDAVGGELRVSYALFKD